MISITVITASICTRSTGGVNACGSMDSMMPSAHGRGFPNRAATVNVRQLPSILTGRRTSSTPL